MTDTPIESMSLEAHGIRFSNDGVSEMDGLRHAVHVRRPTIVRISICHGFQSERFWLATLLSVAILMAGIVGLVMIGQWMFRGGNLPQAIAFAPIGIVVGGWMMWSALQRGYYLKIDQNSDRQKLRFNRAATRQELEAFLHQAETRFGYQIDHDA